MTMKLKQFQADLTAGKYDEKLCKLYGSSDAVLAAQRTRYLQAAENFSRLYPEREEIAVFSAPGRTEIGGNHTDHQHGCVLAASVDLDVIAIVAFHDEHVIRLQSAGYPQDYVDLCDLTVQPEEKGKSAALIRGVVSRFQEMGVAVGGFDAYTTSNVLSGSGLSSSAAFEVLIGTIIDQHYHAGAAGAVEIAKIGQYAENRYFGKKSGLMDQMVSSVGGFVFIDFEDTDNPKIEKLSCQFEDAGYVLCITDTKGSHADLTDDYAAIRREMESVAAFFGKNVLREVNEADFYANIAKIRPVTGDRAVLRAAHFYADSRRARQLYEAIQDNRFQDFLKLIVEGGHSSFEYNQNAYSLSNYKEQGVSIGLAVSQKILAGRGAWRLQGGGFAGTIQAFVPLDLLETYRSAIDGVFGEGSCYVLSVRNYGAVPVTEEM